MSVVGTFRTRCFTERPLCARNSHSGFGHVMPSGSRRNSALAQVADVAPEEIRTPVPQIRSPGRAIEIIEVCYLRRPLESLRKSSLATTIGALPYRKHRPLIQDIFDPGSGPELISDKFPTHAILLVVRNWAGSFGLPMISIIAAAPMARPNGIEWPEISVPEIPLILFRGLFPACERYLQHCWMTTRTT